MAAPLRRCCSASSACCREDEPRLADGTLLSAHQVDALSGTLTALLADAAGPQRQRRAAAAPVRPSTTAGRAASRGTPSDEPEPERGRRGRRRARGRTPVDVDIDLEDARTRPRRRGGAYDDERRRRRRRGHRRGRAEDPNAGKRFWFEHATGAGKTVAALGFVEASRTGGVLILTHRRNLVDQFLGELRDRGYAKRDSPPLLAARAPTAPTARSRSRPTSGSSATPASISDAYTIVICDEAHTALGEKTSAAIRDWTGPIFIGMTATGALIARHVTDLFPTQTSRFDLAQAARRGVIAPLRCVRIPPGPGRAHDRQGAAAPRRGRHRVRPGDAGRAARPAAVQPGDRRPLQDALQRRARASSTPPACATPTTSPRRSARSGIKAQARLGRDAQARAGRDPRRATSAARSTCWSTRSCSPRAGTRRARPSACTSRRPPPSASTSSASAASRAATRARRPASSSTSSTRRPSTTTRS